MSDPHEKRIHIVMQAVRHAAPPAGMEQRILARLAVAELPQARPAWWTLSLPRYAFGAVAIAAAAGLVLQHQAFMVRTNSASAPAHGAMPHTDQTRALDVPSRGVAAHPLSAAPAPHPVARLIPVPSVVQRTLVAGQPLVPGGEDHRSFPAPPLPLTEQEQLLLRLVRHEPPTQLAQLSAPALDAAFQQDKQEVTAFFAPPEPVVAPKDSQSNGQE